MATRCVEKRRRVNDITCQWYPNFLQPDTAPSEQVREKTLSGLFPAGRVFGDTFLCRAFSGNPHDNLTFLQTETTAVKP